MHSWNVIVKENFQNNTFSGASDWRADSFIEQNTWPVEASYTFYNYSTQLLYL